MTQADSDLVTAWLRYHAESGEKGTEDPDWWAVSDLQDIFWDDTDRAWKVAVELARASETEWQVVMIGCGILEDLICEDPDRYLLLLETEGRINRKMVTAAAHVWADEPIRSRLDAVLAKYEQERL